MILSISGVVIVKRELGRIERLGSERLIKGSCEIEKQYLPSIAADSQQSFCRPSSFFCDC